MRLRKSMGLRNNDHRIIPEILISLMLFQTFRIILSLTDIGHFMTIVCHPEKKIKPDIRQLGPLQNRLKLIAWKKNSFYRAVGDLRNFNSPRIPSGRKICIVCECAIGCCYFLFYKNTKFYAIIAQNRFYIQCLIIVFKRRLL